MNWLTTEEIKLLHQYFLYNPVVTSAGDFIYRYIYISVKVRIPHLKKISLADKPTHSCKAMEGILSAKRKVEDSAKLIPW